MSGRTAMWAILLTALWSSSGAVDSEDVQHRLRVAEQLVSEGRLVVASTGDPMNNSEFQDSYGRYPSRFGIGQSLFFVPFVAIVRPLVSLAPLPPPESRKATRFGLGVLLLWTTLTLTFVLASATARALGAGEFAAHVAAFVAVFGSSYWQMAKQQQEEVQLALAALLGLYGFLRWTRTGRLRFAGLSAVAVALATVVRPTAITLAAGISGLYLIGIVRGLRAGAIGWRTVAWVMLAFVVAGASAIVVVLGYNAFKTGSALQAGYAVADVWFDASDWRQGFVGPTVGLDRGIVWRNLWLLPLASVVALRWPRLSFEVKTAVLLAGFLFVASLALYANWISWSGGVHSWGPRFQQHVMPVLTVALVVAALVPKPRGRFGRPGLVVALAVAAAVVQVPGIVFAHNLEAMQAEVAGARGGPGEELTAGRGGQLRTRYENIVSKLTTGSLPALDTLESQRPRIPVLTDVSRWDFWPWRLDKYLGPTPIRGAKVVWLVLLLASIGLWRAWFADLRSRAGRRDSC